VILGVTGSRHGLTQAQMTTVTRLLRQYAAPWGVFGTLELHHGDCAGVDVQVASIAAGLGYRTVSHPPTNESWRGWHVSDEIRPPRDYLARDRTIVHECELLIACPSTHWPQARSGTWYTIRYARQVRRPLLLVSPTGEVIEHQGAP
jgi:hypothetical protein